MSSITHTAGTYFDLVLDLTEYATVAQGARLQMVIARAPGYPPIATIEGGIGQDGANWNGALIAGSDATALWYPGEAHYQVMLIPKTSGLAHIVQQGPFTINARL